MHPPKYLAVAACGVLLLMGCGPIGDEGSGGGGTDSNLGGGIGGSGDGGAGELQVAMVGREQPWIDGLTVTLDQIDLHRSAAPQGDPTGGWVAFDADVEAVDVLALIDGEAAVVLEEWVDADVYDMVRVRLDQAEVTILGETYGVKLIGNSQDLEHPVMDLAVAEGVLTEVTLDFDPLASLKTNKDGSYQLDPTMSIVVPEEVGSISGVTTPPGIDAVIGAFDHRTGKLLAAASARQSGWYTIPRLWVTDSAGKERQYDLRAIASGYVTEDAYDKAKVVGGETVSGFDFAFEPDSEDE